MLVFFLLRQPSNYRKQWNLAVDTVAVAPAMTTTMPPTLAGVKNDIIDTRPTKFRGLKRKTFYILCTSHANSFYLKSFADTEICVFDFVFLKWRVFKECPHPDEKIRLQLSRELNLNPRQIKFWFQNRRTQMKVSFLLFLIK